MIKCGQKPKRKLEFEGFSQCKNTKNHKKEAGLQNELSVWSNSFTTWFIRSFSGPPKILSRLNSSLFSPFSPVLLLLSNMRTKDRL